MRTHIAYATGPSGSHINLVILQMNPVAEFVQESFAALADQEKAVGMAPT